MSAYKGLSRDEQTSPTTTPPEMPLLSSHGTDDLPSADPRSKAERGYALYALFVLTSVYIMNQLDRGVISYIKDYFQKDLDITSAQYGLLTGYGFSMFYVMLGIPAGLIADKFSRKYLLIGGLLVWSAAIFLQGFATNFVTFLLTRLMLGVGQAACNPAAFAMLADFFPESARPMANSIYNMGVAFGYGLASGVGGTLGAPQRIGWRWVLRIFGMIGGGLAVLMFFTVMEPVRGRFSKKKPSKQVQNVDKRQLLEDGDEQEAAPVSFTYGETARFLMSQRSAWLFFVAAGVRSMAGYAFGAFVPSYVTNQFPNHKTLTFWMYGGITAIGGAVASYMGGYISRRWQKKTEKALALVPAYGALLSCPFVMGVIFCHDIISNDDAALAFAYGCLLLAYLTAEVWGGPASAFVQSLVVPAMQGKAIAIYFFVVTILGAGGPAILGLLLQGDVGETTKKIMYAAVIVGCYVGCAVLWIIATAVYKRDLAARKRLEKDNVIPPVSGLCFSLHVLLGVGCVVLAITLSVLTIVLK